MESDQSREGAAGYGKGDDDLLATASGGGFSFEGAFGNATNLHSSSDAKSSQSELASNNAVGDEPNEATNAITESNSNAAAKAANGLSGHTSVGRGGYNGSNNAFNRHTLANAKGGYSKGADYSKQKGMPSAYKVMVRKKEQILSKIQAEKNDAEAMFTNDDTQSDFLASLLDSLDELKKQVMTADYLIRLNELDNQLRIELQRHSENLPSFDALKEEAKRNIVVNVDAKLEHVKEMFRKEPENYSHLTLVKSLETIKSVTHLGLKELDYCFKMELHQHSRHLPIYDKKCEILETISKNQVTILVAETGSGKSTQLVQYLLCSDSAVNKGSIVCTQPRKVAAISLANHVAKELESKAGETVGYQVGSKSCHNKSTRIIYMTDSTLLRQAVKDHFFGEYSCIIIDEAHERTLYTDLLLGKLKSCLHKRRDLRVIITSATINPKLFCEYFSNFDYSLIEVKGRVFPVDQHWVPNDAPNSDMRSDYLERTIKQIEKICGQNNSPEHGMTGDVLAFLTSPADIGQAEQRLLKLGLSNVKIFQLHGQLQSDDQQKVLEPLDKGVRKVVLATNIAETSITIPGITYVIDCGLVKEQIYDSIRGTSCLMIKPISKSSANQRKGRAGRTEYGVCYRLYSEEEYEKMEEHFVPEILRTNLGLAFLTLKMLGIKDPVNFDFIEKPSIDSMEQAVCLLKDLGALDKNINLTEIGRKMSQFTLEPRHSKILLSASKHDEQNDIKVFWASLILAACLNTGTNNMFYRGSSDSEKSEASAKKVGFCDETGDPVTALKLYLLWLQNPVFKRNQWCAENYANAKSLRTAHETYNELKRISEQLKLVNGKVTVLNNITEEVVRKVNTFLLDSFKTHVAFYTGHPRIGYYSPHIDSYFFIHPSSAMFVCDKAPEWILFEYILKTSRNFGHVVCEIDEKMFNECKVSEILIKEATDRKVVPVKFEGIAGPQMKRFIMKRENREVLEVALEEKIGSKCTIDLPKKSDPWTRLTLYCRKDSESDCISIIQDFLIDIRSSLENGSIECKLSEGNPWRILLGNGGKGLLLLAEHEFLTVKLENVNKNWSKNDILKKMATYGTVVNHNMFRNNGRTWGTITYSSESEAVAAEAALPGKSLIVRPWWSKGENHHNNFSMVKVSNIEDNGSVDQVLESMAVFGKILCHDHDNEQLKVTYESSTDAQSAVDAFQYNRQLIAKPYETNNSDSLEKWQSFKIKLSWLRRQPSTVGFVTIQEQSKPQQEENVYQFNGMEIEEPADIGGLSGSGSPFTTYHIFDTLCEKWQCFRSKFFTWFQGNAIGVTYARTKIQQQKKVLHKKIINEVNEEVDANGQPLESGLSNSDYDKVFHALYGKLKFGAHVKVNGWKPHDRGLGVIYFLGKKGDFTPQKLRYFVSKCLRKYHLLFAVTLFKYSDYRVIADDHTITGIVQIKPEATSLYDMVYDVLQTDLENVPRYYGFNDHVKISNGAAEETSNQIVIKGRKLEDNEFIKGIKECLSKSGLHSSLVETIQCKMLRQKSFITTRKEMQQIHEKLKTEINKVSEDENKNDGIIGPREPPHNAAVRFEVTLDFKEHILGTELYKHLSGPTVVIHEGRPLTVSCEVKFIFAIPRKVYTFYENHMQKLIQNKGFYEVKKIEAKLSIIPSSNEGVTLLQIETMSIDNMRAVRHKLKSITQGHTISCSQANGRMLFQKSSAILFEDLESKCTIN